VRASQGKDNEARAETIELPEELAYGQDGQPSGRKGVPWRRVIALLLGLGILAVLFSTVGAADVWRVLSRAHAGWLFFALLCFVPQFVVIGWRWQRMTRAFVPMTMVQCVQLVLATNTANVVLPSKLGDLGKGVVLARSGKISLPGGMSLVVLEKLMDVAALAVIMLAGTAVLLSGLKGLSPLHQGAALMASFVGLAALVAIAVLYLAPLPSGKSEAGGALVKVVKVARGARDGLNLLRSHGASGLLLLGSTMAIWMLHMVQIWAFFQAVGAQPDLARFLCLAPLAIFIGLVPITFGGFGTRDSALVALFVPIPEPVMLSAALLVNTRYIVPALLGWPFFHRYAVRS
jgi:uncharacterized protein (TIRG00374 family)